MIPEMVAECEMHKRRAEKAEAERDCLAARWEAMRAWLRARPCQLSEIKTRPGSWQEQFMTGKALENVDTLVKMSDLEQEQP